jgi:hypothetical protein
MPCKWACPSSGPCDRALLDCFRDLAAARIGEKVLSFDGRLSAQARSRVVDEFLNGESRLLCLSLGAGAYGLNLVPGPSAMIILDVWFNPVGRGMNDRHLIASEIPEAPDASEFNRYIPKRYLL